MTITSEIEELQSINSEIKRIRLHLKTLLESKHRVENIIIKYLENQNQPGLRYNGKTIIAEKKSKRAYKKKADKYNDAENILKQLGVSQSKDVLNDIIEAMKGDEVEKKKIKMY